ncbi:MAG: hypothetical protein HC927_02415 [Deltaproteobacteria bacterium]|nr:hypothetical protein [Deltaproteobacteria bacterium]
MPNYTVSGRIVAPDGTPVYDAQVQVLEIQSLSTEAELSSDRTDSDGRYLAAWTQSSVPNPWDFFVRATLGSDVADSSVISDPSDLSLTVDLVLGEGAYEGRTEWDRVTAKLTPLLGATAVKDVPVERLEWLARRADVFPLHLAAYIQAHRLADGHTVKPESCYAFLRAGLPSDLRGLLRAGEAAWESALRDAWSRHLLPLPGSGTEQDMDDEVVAEVAAMRELWVDAAVAEPSSGVNQRVIFDTAALDPNDQRTFAQLWLANEGDVDAFWAAVAGSSLSGQIDQLKFTVHAATLVGAHVGTLAALQEERDASNISTVADTAEWSVADWDAVLVARTVTPPDTIPGSGTEQRQTYARTLFNILEDAYPSASLRASIDRESTPPPSTEFVVTFLTNNPDFDIVESTVAHYLAGASSPWTGIDSEDQAQARANLETLQRVYRMTPRIGRYATTKVLLDQGITSATQVVASTRSEFVAKFGPLFVAGDHDGEALAGATWDNAAKIHATVIAMASQLALAKTNADFVPVVMPGSEAFAEATNGLSELEAILGNLDYCACEHCRSVFSPAAYLADLLAFLEQRPAEESDHALAVLLARRPDLEHILLDCANTNTVLPYIDLVNELLEDFIAGGLGASSKQTTWTAAELRLHPEHLDAAVYEGATLTQTVHPWTLPFSLPTVEARTYLQHLGVPRHELMRRFAPVSPSNEFIDAMAADILGLDAVTFTIVAGTYTGNRSTDNREYWGFADDPGNDGWALGLAGDIGEILLRGRLELPELRELLELDFIDSSPGEPLELQWDDSCELAEASISFLDAAALDRIHRFVRLQRATAIPGRMLNVLLRDVLGGTLDTTALRSLADIVRVKNRLRLSWDEVATFWADTIDARDYEKEPRSLYARRFLGKDFGPVDPNFVPDGAQLTGEAEPTEPVTDTELPACSRRSASARAISPCSPRPS